MNALIGNGPTNLWQTACEHSNTGVWQRDVASGVEHWSSKYCQLYGLDMDQCGSSSFENWLSVVHPEDRERVLRDHDRIRRTRAAHLRNEFRIRHPSGERWIEEIGSNLYDENGNLIEMVGIAIDITHRKSTELRLRAINRSRNQLISMFGHQLRSPLAVMESALRIHRNKPDVLPRPFERIIEEQSAELGYVIERLLADVRIHEDDFSLSYSFIDPRAHAKRVLERTMMRYANKHSSIDFICSEDLPMIWADPFWFDQVCDNLLSNACKYSEAGATISISLSDEGSRIALTVADSGDGLSSADIERIFELHVRGEHALNGQHEGFGIGLTIVKKIVLMHEGDLQVESRGPKKGSKFTAWFPHDPSARTSGFKLGTP
ncbi:MAG: PAS domain-containing sensor histidine kinase [Bdellovibrionales bacterium]|nr:PAS domain-containing sensor histidine kinase [Bdellovibrionales bacterium]